MSSQDIRITSNTTFSESICPTTRTNYQEELKKITEDEARIFNYSLSTVLKHECHTSAETYQNFKYLHSGTFSYKIISADSLVQRNETCLSSCMLNDRLLYGFTASKSTKYDESDGQFIGLLNAVLDRKQAIFIYLSDKTLGFDIDSNFFYDYQYNQIGRTTPATLMSNNIFKVGYSLYWDSTNNTYKTYSTKSAYDAYKFVLEKANITSNVNGPIYMYYGKTSNGEEVIKYGSFSSQYLATDSLYKQYYNTKSALFYRNYLMKLTSNFLIDFKYAKALEIKSKKHDFGFYANTTFDIDCEFDNIELLRTGLWYANKAYDLKAILQISKNTNIPVIICQTYNQYEDQTTGMPNNMEEIKWQPTSANKMYEICNSIITYSSNCLIGPYTSTTRKGIINTDSTYSGSTTTIDANNELRTYLESCNAFLVKSTNYDILTEILGITSNKYKNFITFYICLGFDIIDTINILDVAKECGLTVSSTTTTSLVDSCPYIKYTDSITYKGSNITYNYIESGTIWWNDNINQLRKAIKDKIYDNINKYSQSGNGSYTLAFDANGGTGYIAPITSDESSSSSSSDSSSSSGSSTSSDSSNSGSSETDYSSVESYTYKNKTYYSGQWIIDPDSNCNFIKSLANAGKSFFVEATNLIFNSSGKMTGSHCSHCTDYYKNFFHSTVGGSPTFSEWMKTSGMYFIIYSDKDGKLSDTKSAFFWNYYIKALKVIANNNDMFDGNSYNFPTGLLVNQGKAYYFQNGDTWYNINTNKSKFVHAGNGDSEQKATYSKLMPLFKKCVYARSQDGDIRNHVTYTTDMAIYPRGWIYFTGTDAQDASTLLTNLANSGYKALVFQHAMGCTLCSSFISSVLYDSEVISTLANSNLVLIDFYSSSGWWTSKNQRALLGSGLSFGIPNAAILNGNQTLNDAYNSGNFTSLQNASKSYFLNWLSNYL